MKTLTTERPTPDAVTEATRALEAATAERGRILAELEGLALASRPTRLAEADEKVARAEAAVVAARDATRLREYQAEHRELAGLVQRKERLLDQAAAIEAEIAERRRLVPGEAVLIPGCLSPEALEHRRRIARSYGFDVS